MSNKQTIKYEDIDLNKAAINEIELTQIQTAKKSNKSSLFSLAVIGLNIIASLGSTVDTVQDLRHDHKDKILKDMSLALLEISTAAGLSALELSKIGKRKSLDLIEYIKTGNPGEVLFEDTPSKAAELKIKIG